MTLGPHSKVKLMVADYLKITGFLVAWSIIGYAFIANGQAAQRQDQAINNQKFDSITRWQDDATQARKEIFQSLSDIKASLGRIEGRMESHP